MTKTNKATKVFGNIYATPTGLKIGSKGKVLSAAEALKQIPDKGERRKIRKALHAAGRVDLAAAR